MHRSALILSLVVALTVPVLSTPIGVRSEKHIFDRELKSIATRAPFFTGLPLGSVALERRQTVGSSSPGVAGGPSSPGIGEDPSSPGVGGGSPSSPGIGEDPSSPGVGGGSPSSPGIGEDPSSPGEAGQGEGQSAG